MSKNIKKTDPKTKTVKWDAIVTNWPNDVDDLKRVQQAIEMWGASFCIRAVDQTAQIDARAFGESLIDGNNSRTPMSVKDMQKEMLNWAPNKNPAKRGLSATEKMTRMIEKSGLSKAEILELLK